MIPKLIQWSATLVIVGLLVYMVILKSGILSPIENFGLIVLILTVVAIWSKPQKRIARRTASVFNGIWFIAGFYYLFAPDYELFVAIIVVTFTLLNILAMWIGTSKLGKERAISKSPPGESDDSTCAATSDAERSILLWSLRIVYRLLSFLSLIRWVEKASEKDGKRLPFWQAELWVFLLLGLQLFTLYVIGESQTLLSYIVAISVAIYCLLELLGANMRDTIIIKKHDSVGPFLTNRNPSRWIILAVLSAFEVILCFAILYQQHFESFSNLSASDPTIAVYQSFLTFTTLGYGDITPINNTGRSIVIGELCFFILFLIVRLPVAVSVIRVKVVQRESIEDNRRNDSGQVNPTVGAA